MVQTLMNIYNWFKSNNDQKQFIEEIKNIGRDARIQNGGRYSLDSQASRDF